MTEVKNDAGEQDDDDILAKVPMRVNVVGFMGVTASLIAMYDPNKEILAVKEVRPYEDRQRKKFLCITTQERDKFHDALFVRDDFQEAVRAYLEMHAGGLVQFGSTVGHFTPDSSIERDGVNEHGDKYKLDPDITNGQIAVLAACLFAKRQRGAHGAEDMMRDLLALSDIITI